MGGLQTAFDFDVAPSCAPASSVEQRLQHLLGDALGTPVAVTWTDNARSMVTARRRGALTCVRLHHMFTDADEPTVRAVARFLMDGQGPASRELTRFIESKRERVVPVLQARVSGKTAHYHDLHAILREVNSRYFEPAVDACIGWARPARAVGRRRKRRSIRLGSCLGGDRAIRIHPVLDARWVPRFFVEYIVYHEMLHDVLGMPERNGRRRLHGPEFRARERMFERYADAIAWEQANLDRLLSG